MMNRFAIGQARLVKNFLANAKVDITYHKMVGSIDTPISVECWVGTFLFKILDKDNQRMEWSDRDYLIPVENLKIVGVKFLPNKGDWIEETLPEGVVQYELSAPEKEPVWRYDDPQHTVIRVHTKRVTA